jgi:acyl-[acyl-carrier-protein] desaturase
MSLTGQARELLSKVEVLKDLESIVREMMATHERKRVLWMPSDLLGLAEGDCSETHLRNLRARAQGIPFNVRAALAVNTSRRRAAAFPSPPGRLPRRRQLLAHLEQSLDRRGRPAWPGAHDYTRDTQLFDQRKFEEMQFEYIRAGFHPSWDRDPYRVFAYTTVQERATQHSHAETGRVAEEYEPGLAAILAEVAQDEARHFVFYRSVFEEILKRDPNQALESASHILPGIEMPGASMPGFRDFADVIRRTGIYGPRDYLRIVQEQVRYWKIEGLTGLNDMGRKAQESIMLIPDRLRRLADLVETRSRAKTFSFDVAFNREFSLP